MSSFVNQVLKLAAETARLARMLSVPTDVLAAVVRQMREAGIAVTHCGHAAFKSVGVAFSGADGFQLEDALLRRFDGGIRIDTEETVRWFGMNAGIRPGADAILSLTLETAPDSVVTVFVRNRIAGRSVDGERIVLGSGTIDTDVFVPRAAGEDGADYASFMFVTVSNFSSATIRQFQVAVLPDR